MVHICGAVPTKALSIHFLVGRYLGLLQVGTMTAAMSLQHLLFVVSAASALSSRYQRYYRFTGGSLTFIPKYSDGKYEVGRSSIVSAAEPLST